MVALFDRAAKDYDAWYEDGLGKLVDQAERTLVKKMFKPSGGRILEVGCGTGQYALWLAAQGYDLTAVDVSSAMLAQARAKLAKRGLRATWYEADIRDIQKRLGSYHGILAVTALEFIPDPAQLLAALFEHLAPGGCLVVGFIGGGSAWSRLYAEIAAADADSVFAQARFYTEEEIRAWKIGDAVELAGALYFPPEVASAEQAQQMERERSGCPGFLVAKWVKR